MVRHSSEQQLQCKLHLAGRAGFTRWESRTLDDSKSCAARSRSQAGISEIGMVEDVEYLPSELCVKRFPDRRVFENGKIDIVVTRSRERVPTHVPKVNNTGAIHQADRHGKTRTGRALAGSGRIANGIAEPLVGRADHLNRSNHIGPDRRNAGEGADGGRRCTA